MAFVDRSISIHLGGRSPSTWPLTRGHAAPNATRLRSVVSWIHVASTTLGRHGVFVRRMACIMEYCPTFLFSLLWSAVGSSVWCGSSAVGLRGFKFSSQMYRRSCDLSTHFSRCVKLHPLSPYGCSLDSLPLLYAGYGVLAGTGIGLAYTPPIQTLMAWFPNQRALASGLTIAG